MCLAGQSVTDSSHEVIVTKVEETSVSVKVAAEAIAAVAAKKATVENCIVCVSERLGELMRQEENHQDRNCCNL